jgi:hypothetical protein
MKILTLTGYDRNMRELAELCLPSKQAWADRWDMELHILRDHYPSDFPKEHGHPSFQKLRHIRWWLGHYDVVWWMDADSIITNLDRDPRELIHECEGVPFAVSGDYKRQDEDHRPWWNQWSAGHAIWFNDPRALDLLDEAVTRTEFEWSGLWDQDALQESITHDEDDRNPLVLPPRVMNAVLPGLTGWERADWQSGDFLCHFTGIHPAQRLKVAYDFIRRLEFSTLNPSEP